jgi:RecB family exonuclease
MGLLESRGLDFDHLLLLGASEGSLPRIKPPDSFLPDNIRRAYGMPVPEHQDAIFAYVFYRLLHRCQSMVLVYNALVTDNSTGEVSRFVQQLAFETQIPLQYSRVQRAAGPQAPASICIQKDDALMRRLYGQFFADEGRSISPSAINTYLNCRLQFFFKYIGRLQAPEELEEGVEANQVGSVVHRLMEILYEAVVTAMGPTISEPHIDWMLGQREVWVEQAFKDSWRRKPVEGRFEFSGELHVVRAVVLHYAQLLLEVDRAYTPFTWHNNEEKLAQPFEFSAGGQRRKISIVGHIDRVDEKDGVYRMLDYKTGSDEPVFRNVAALFERDGRHQNKAALQTLIYSWLFQQAHPEWPRFEPALVAPRYLNSSRAADTRLQETDARQPVSAERVPDLLTQMTKHLSDLLAELLDPQVPFDQTTDAARCQYCDFIGICGR